MIKARILTPILLTAALGITGCSSGGDDSADGDTNTNGGVNTDGSTNTDGDTNTDGSTSGNGTTLGFVSIDIYEEEIDPFALFMQLSQSISAEQVLDQFELLPSSDNCSVERSDALDLIDNDDDYDLLEFSVTHKYIGAGNSITISSPNGTYATLQRFSHTGPSGTIVAYEIDGAPLTGPAPNGLTVDIPGEANGFPAQSNLQIPDAVPLLVSAPSANDTVTPATQFNWTPGGSDSMIDLSANSFVSDGTSAELVSVDCTLVDDGSFTFPASIQSQMGSDFMSSGFEMSRTVIDLRDLGNDTLLLLGNTSGYQ